jgi:hypothetical protein
VTGVVPEGGSGHPFDQLQVQFSEAVQDSSLTLSQIDLSGSSGPIAPRGITPLAPNLYAIDFTGLTGMATYTLDIGPDIQAANGDTLDQEHDGLDPDPTGDAYHGTLAAAGLTIGAQDATQDGRDLVLDGGTTVIDGSQPVAPPGRRLDLGAQRHHHRRSPGLDRMGQ